MSKKKKIRKERKQIENLNQNLLAQDFLLKNNWAIQIVKFKLEMIDYELSTKYKRIVMQKVEHRIKKPQSIAKKLIRKGYEISFENAITHLNDIAGVRIVCLYRDDVYKIAELLKLQKDFKLIKQKDYIKKPKDSGYQSLHLIMDIPLVYKDSTNYQRVEIQIRTVAMDFWAAVDNQICYKKSPEDVEKAEEELKNYSYVISKMDKEMLELRKMVEKM